ncbi:hypothetical protein BHM03_00055437 [Ensete ventricosum]|nr:hypothetical protein BHM03_00055437 [Ensete ventricosum]
MDHTTPMWKMDQETLPSYAPPDTGTDALLLQPGKHLLGHMPGLLKAGGFMVAHLAAAASADVVVMVSWNDEVAACGLGFGVAEKRGRPRDAGDDDGWVGW